MKRLITVCLVLLIAGCGYSTRSLISARYKTIHVMPFKNKVDYGTETVRNLYIPLLEVDVTNEVIDRFLFDGNLRIAKKDKADVILQGELVNFERQALRYVEDDTDTVREYRINIIVNLKLYEPGIEELPIWEEANFVGDATYFVSGTLAKTESEAIDDALKDTARRVVERVIEDW